VLVKVELWARGGGGPEFGFRTVERYGDSVCP
jgi:hypothetical protein